MAKYSNTVEYQIRTTLDSSGIAKLKAELNSLKNLANTYNARNVMGFDKDTTNKVIADIKKVENAMNQAFNPKLGMVSNRSLFKSIGSDLNGIYNSFSKLGPQGVRAFGQVYGQIGKIDLGMKQISSTADKIANTFGNTFRWGIIASMFSGIMNSFHQATQYVNDLDTSLTNIMMVSGESRDAMNEYARAANAAAKALGNTTVGMTNATQVFVQQGYDLPTSQTLAESSVILGNISQQDTATASDEITAYMNAFNININDLNNALSKWAIVANVSAADVQELSIASQKAASAAVTTGVNMDQLAAQIAAIETVTKEAPENIGNGLKTLYARFSDIKMGETLEDGVNLGQVTKTLQKVGVQVLDAEGNMREVGAIMEDLMEVWGDLDLTQRNAIGQTLAGKFQYTRFSALMNRSDLYKEYLAASQNETGTATMDMMQDVYEKSMQGRLNRLQASIEGIFTNAFDTDNFYALIDAATLLTETFDNLIQSIGGGSNALLGLGAIITRVFSRQIGQGIANTIANRATNAQGRDNRQWAAITANAQLAGHGLNVNDPQVMSLVNSRANVMQHASNMSNEQIQEANQLWEKQINLFTQLSEAEEKHNQTVAATKAVLVQVGFTAKEADEYMTALLQTMENAGEESQISKNTLQEIGIDKYINKIAGAGTDITEFTGLLGKENKTTKDWDTIIDKAELLSAGLQEIGEKAGFTGEKAETLNKALGQLQTIIDGNAQDLQAAGDNLRSVGVDLDQLRQGLAEVAENGLISSDEFEKQASSTDALRQALGQLKAESEGMAKGLDIQDFVSGLTNMGSAAMSAMFGVRSLIGAFSALGNEALGPFEKLEQAVMGFGMTAATFGPMLKQFIDWYRQLTLFLPLYSGLQAGINTQELIQSGIKAELVNIIRQELLTEEGLSEAKIQAIVETGEYTREEVELAAAKMANVKASKQELLSSGLSMKMTKNLGLILDSNIGKKLVSISATLGLSSAETIMTAASGEAAIAATGLGAAIGSLLLPLGIAAAAITAIVIALKLAYDAYNADAVAAEKAKETAAALNKEWQDSKQRLDDLNASLEQIKEVDDAFDKLTKGTQEWNDKLRENNDLVLSLIAAYPELAKEVTRTNNGQLEISAIGQSQLKQSLEAVERSARNSAYGAQILSNQASLRSEETDTARKISQSGTWNADRVDALADYMIKNNMSAAELKEEDIKAALSSQGVTDTAIDGILRGIDRNGGYLDQIANKKESTLSAERTFFDEIMTEQFGQDYVNLSEKTKNRLFEDFTEAANTAKNFAGSTKDLAKDFAEAHKYMQDSVRESDGGWVMKDATGKESDVYSQEEMNQDYKFRQIMPDFVKSVENTIKSGDDLTDEFGVLSKAVKVNTDETNKNSDLKSFRFNYDTKQQLAINKLQTNTSIPTASENSSNQTLSSKSVIDTTGLAQDEIATLVGEINKLSEEDLQPYLKKLGIESRQILIETIAGGKDEVAQIYSDFLMAGLEQIEATHLDSSEWVEKLDVDENQFKYIQENYEKNSASLTEWRENIKSTSKELEENKVRLEDSIKALKAKTDKSTDDIRALDRMNASLEKTNQLIAENAQDSEDYAEIVDDLAGRYAEASNGLSLLAQNWDDWSQKLTDGDIKVQGEVFTEIADALSKLIGVDASTFDTGFIQTNLENIELAAQGDVQAIENLKWAAAEKIFVDAGLTEEGKGLPQEFDSIISDLYSAAQAANFEMGAYLDNSDVINKFQEMVATGKWSAKEIKAATDAITALGIEVDIDYSAINQAVKKFSDKQLTALGATGFQNPFQVQQYVNGLVEEEERVTKQFMTFRYVGNGGQDFADSSMPSSTGGSGGGGGGGGGGGSTPSKKEAPKNEKDLYEKVNTRLNYINADMTRLNREQDKLGDGGTKWLKVLEEQKKVLDDQVVTLQEKLAIQEQEAKDIRGKTNKDGSQTGLLQFGAKFGPDNQLSNYSNIWNNLNDAVVKAVNNYNQAVDAGKDETTLKGLEDKITAAQDRFDLFLKLYQRYDQLWGTDIPATKEEIEKANDAIGDLGETTVKAARDAGKALQDWIKDINELTRDIGNIRGQHFKVDLDFNTAEWDRIIGDGADSYLNKQIAKLQEKRKSATKEQKAWINSQIKIMREAIKNGTSLMDLTRQNLANVQAMRDEYNKTGKYTITDANGTKYTSDDEKFLQEIEQGALEDYQSLVSELSSLIQDTYGEIDDLIDHMNDNLDDVVKKFETITDKADYVKDLYELRYGDRVGKELVDAANAQAQAAIGTRNALSTSRDYYEQVIKQYEKLIEAEGKEGKNNIEYQNRIREAREKIADIDAQILEQNQAIVEAYKEARDVANQLALQKWTDSFRGEGGQKEGAPLAYAADQWERIKENEALYLDDLNKSYETQKLQNKYQDLLNKSTDPSIQREITKQMQEQLKYLREKDKLSKYDVEYANAQLEILQKRIALEDAQAAKNTMKLRRDSQGNYQYVYAVDQNNVANAQNELLDAEMEAYNMSKNHQREVQDNIISGIQKMADNIEKVMTDDSLTKKQREDLLKEIREQGNYYLDSQAEQLSDAQKKMIDSFLDAAEDIEAGNRTDAVTTLLNNMDLETFDNEIDETFNTFIKNWLTRLQDSTYKFSDKNPGTKLQTTILDNWTKYQTNIEKALEKFGGDIEGLIEQIGTGIKTDIKQANKEAAKLGATLGADTTIMKDFTDNLANAAKQLNNLNAALKKLLTTANQGIGDNAVGSNATFIVGEKVKYTGSGSAKNGWEKDKQYTIQDIDRTRTDGKYYKIDRNGKGGWVSLNEIQGYATGGYTGTWPGTDIEEDGRLAVLHQKELVLNATDTENILAAVDSVRAITSQLKNISLTTGLASIGKIVQSGIGGNNVEQRVEITANFPNATSSEEIQNALINLSDTAYQYAYNKNNIPW